MPEFTLRRELGLSLLVARRSLLLELLNKLLLLLLLRRKLLLLSWCKLLLLLLLEKLLWLLLWLLLLRLLRNRLPSSGIKLSLEPWVRSTWLLASLLLFWLLLEVVLPRDKSRLRSRPLLECRSLLLGLLEALLLLLKSLLLLESRLLLLLEGRLLLERILLLSESISRLLLLLGLEPLLLLLLLSPLLISLLLSYSVSLLLLLQLSLSLNLCGSLLLKFSGDHLCESIRVQGDEHVEGMLQDLISQGIELFSTEPLQLRAKGSKLLVELGLLISG